MKKENNLIREKALNIPNKGKGDPEKHKGIVVKFFKSKGYGFILDENSKYYFVHTSEVLNAEKLIVNSEVYFKKNESIKGLSAFDVEVVALPPWQQNAANPRMISIMFFISFIFHLFTFLFLFEIL